MAPITWYNPRFSEIMGNENMLDNNIAEYTPELNPKNLLSDKSENSKLIRHQERWYNVIWVPVQIDALAKKSRAIILLYWEDITEEVELREIYEKKQIVVVNIQIDNYDEVMANTEDTKKPVFYGD